MIIISYMNTRNFGLSFMKFKILIYIKWLIFFFEKKGVKLNSKFILLYFKRDFKYKLKYRILK